MRSCQFIPAVSFNHSMSSDHQVFILPSLRAQRSLFNLIINRFGFGNSTRQNSFAAAQPLRFAALPRQARAHSESGTPARSAAFWYSARSASVNRICRTRRRPPGTFVGRPPLFVMNRNRNGKTARCKRLTTMGCHYKTRITTAYRRPPHRRSLNLHSISRSPRPVR